MTENQKAPLRARRTWTKKSIVNITYVGCSFFLFRCVFILAVNFILFTQRTLHTSNEYSAKMSFPRALRFCFLLPSETCFTLLSTKSNRRRVRRSRMAMSNEQKDRTVCLCVTYIFTTAISTQSTFS